MKTSRLLLSFTCLSLVLLASSFRMRDIKPLTTPDPAGPASDTLNLDKYKGKVVILNFWASWSKASRAENKNIVRVYQKYKNNAKVVFVSVSLDTDQESWKTAIAEDELAWVNQVCDFKKYQSPIAMQYGVNTVPRIFLVDAKGHISKSSAKMIDLETSIDALLK